MAIYNPVLLPLTLMEANTGASRHVGNMVLLPSVTSADLLRNLANEAQVPIDEVVAFLLNAKTREIVRISSNTDLVHEQPVGLVVVVGLCAICEKEVDGAPLEFHHCPHDEVVNVMDFRSPVGPIQRPPGGTVVCD